MLALHNFKNSYTYSLQMSHLRDIGRSDKTVSFNEI